MARGDAETRNTLLFYSTQLISRHRPLHAGEPISFRTAKTIGAPGSAPDRVMTALLLLRASAAPRAKRFLSTRESYDHRHQSPRHGRERHRSDGGALVQAGRRRGKAR